jgi:hypothetical protein
MSPGNDMIGPVRALQDSVVVESPIPGGTAEFFRFVFNFPQWAQITGFFVGLVAAVFVVRWIWQRRAGIAMWIKSRSRGVRWVLAGGTVAGGLVAIAVGGASWNYMQHDNGFCTGCHVMEDPFGAFALSAGRHEELQCHDCHKQPVSASLRQLFLWVAERPDEIQPHAPVPNARCDECHNVGADTTWQHIATTAGHRVHLESDSTALDSVMCVTCHGETVHRFVPVRQTCGQSGCHETEQTDMVLGSMAEQNDAHCTTCHVFTADVPLLATVDSARGTLVPNDVQCFGCHEMETLLADFNPRLDPHSSTCGMCHNPHSQERPADAGETCQACHDDWRDRPFHVGANHRAVAEQCLTCHPNHAAKVDASDCVGCHESVNEDGTNRHAPLPFDTAAALREAFAPPVDWEDQVPGHAKGTPSPRPRDATGRHLLEQLPTPPPGREAGAQALSLAPGPEPRRGKGDVLLSEVLPRPPPAPADTFPHDRHEEVACLSCHVTGEGHGGLTFEQPRGCAICHHRGPSTNDCSTCHAPDEFEESYAVEFAVQVDDRAPRRRAVAFQHQVHADEGCIECHQVPVSMALSVEAVQCRACHENHHESVTQCATCHRTPAVLEEHTVLEAHQRCDACHTTETIALLQPERSFCLACHDPEVDHYEDGTCSRCHLQSDPEHYRPLLLGATP